jgi:hypothetical protein
MIDLQTISLVVQTIGVASAAIAAVIGVRSYVNSNKRAQDTRERELETRQAQLFVQLFSHYNTREFLEDYLEVISTEYSSLEEWYKKYFFRDDWKRSIFPSWIRVGRYFDGAGILVKKKLIDVDLANELLRELVIQSWEAMKLWVVENRKGTKNEAVWRNFEYLYDEVKKTQPDMISRDELIRAGRSFTEEFKKRP